MTEAQKCRCELNINRVNGINFIDQKQILQWWSPVTVKNSNESRITRVSVQGVKSLGGHFARLCRGFEFYEVKKNCYYFSKRNWK